MDRVVIKSAKYWKRMAGDLLAKSSTDKSVEENQSSDP